MSDQMLHGNSKTMALISLVGGLMFAGVAGPIIWPDSGGVPKGLDIQWPKTVECGDRKEVVVSVPVENRFTTTRVITGGRTSCYCGELLDLPLELEPGEKTAFRISFDRAPSDPPFILPVELYITGATGLPAPQAIEFR